MDGDAASSSSASGRQEPDEESSGSSVDLDSSVDSAEIAEWSDNSDISVGDVDLNCTRSAHWRNLFPTSHNHAVGRGGAKCVRYRNDEHLQGRSWQSRAFMVYRRKPLFGSPWRRGETRRGTRRAGQFYGDARLDNNDVLYPVNSALEPIHVIPENYGWTDEERVPEAGTFDFDGDVKGEVLYDPSTTVDEMFHKLFDDALDLLMKGTNDKAYVSWRSKRKKHSRNFKPFSRSDFLAFIAALLHMDTEVKPNIRQYWNRDDVLGSKFVRESLSAKCGMSSRKFQNMLKCVRLYDADKAAFYGKSDRSSVAFDNQHKTRDFMNTIFAAAQKYRKPGCFLAIDESMMKFTGLCSFVQFVRRKPIKRGLKFFYLCDSSDGYTYNGMLYSSDEMPYTAEMGPTFAYCWNLLSGANGDELNNYLRKGHCVYTDRAYTSVPLYYALAKAKTFGAGTIVAERKNTPKFTVRLQIDEDVAAGGNAESANDVTGGSCDTTHERLRTTRSAMPAQRHRRRGRGARRGGHTTTRSGAVGTRDAETVKVIQRTNLLSNDMLDRGDMLFKHDTVGMLSYVVWKDSKVVRMLYSDPSLINDRSFCERREKGQTESRKLDQPTIIQLFDKKMGGVDVCDQLLAAQRRHLRTYVWYVGILKRGIDIVVNNIYANLKFFGAAASILEIKRPLAATLAKEAEIEAKNAYMPKWCHPVNVMKKSVSKEEVVGKHFVTKVAYKERKRCVVCRKRSRIVCADCDVYVHVNCSPIYHMSRYPKYNVTVT